MSCFNLYTLMTMIEIIVEIADNTNVNSLPLVYRKISGHTIKSITMAI